MLLGSLKLEWTHIYSMLHGQQAGLQKLQQDSLFHVCQLTSDLKQNDEEKAIYGLHYNDECMYDLKKAKRQTSIGFKVNLLSFDMFSGGHIYKLSKARKGLLYTTLCIYMLQVWVASVTSL